MKKIIIINGPNLNLLGIRNQAVYGTQNFYDYFITLKEKYKGHFDILYFQSNSEGQLIDWIQEFGFSNTGIIINAGGYTHTSVAIHDAIEAITTPCLEVHISNIYSREEFRQKSLLSAVCKGSVIGFGLKGYDMALEYFK